MTNAIEHEHTEILLDDEGFEKGDWECSTCHAHHGYKENADECCSLLELKSRSLWKHPLTTENRRTLEQTRLCLSNTRLARIKKREVNKMAELKNGQSKEEIQWRGN